MSKFTQTYPGHIKPVREGFYQDGRRFGFGYDSPSYRERHSLPPSPDKNLPWRGLKSEAS